MICGETGKNGELTSVDMLRYQKINLLFSLKHKRRENKVGLFWRRTNNRTIPMLRFGFAILRVHLVYCSRKSNPSRLFENSSFPEEMRRFDAMRRPNASRLNAKTDLLASGAEN